MRPSTGNGFMTDFIIFSLRLHACDDYILTRLEVSEGADPVIKPKVPSWSP